MTLRTVCRTSLLAGLALHAGACHGWQTPLDPQSGDAGHLAHLFWFFLVICAVVWLLVAAALLYVLLRRRPDAEGHEEAPAQHRRKTVIVSALVAATAAILVLLTLLSFYATRGFLWTDPKALIVKITAQQWWWQVEYSNPDASQRITAADELHIPVGIPVLLNLQAHDVIHSFWVPNLMGKQDLIPGRQNHLMIRADHPGIYRGQCAEFCGLQHTHMAFVVFADPPAKFEAWRRHQLLPAATPGAPLRLQGMRFFLNGPCAVCHSVEGTPAGGQTAPDLTHFGSQATIAAGTLHNTPQDLWRWLSDPQEVKPGTNMPKVSMSNGERAALVAYLEGLK